MLMLLLYWNLCGTGNARTLGHLRGMIKNLNLKIVAIVEPKISGDRATVAIRRLGFDGFVREGLKVSVRVYGYYGRTIP